MVVFPHSCLPLTSNLKLDLRESDRLKNVDLDQVPAFQQVLNYLIAAIRKGSHPKDEISWDYNYDSLWSPKLRGHKGRVNIWKCSADTFIGLLRSRSHWYKRLPKSGRRRVKKLASTTTGRRFLKDCLDTCDGVLTSLIFSFPEMFRTEGGYTLSDRITGSILMNCFHSYSKFQKKLKLLRKTVRHGFLSKEGLDDLRFDDYRDMSYFILPIKLFKANMNKTSKSWMFRLALFTQTRATGLAGREQVKESIDEFIEQSKNPIEYKPNELLCKAIEDVTSDLASKVDLGSNPEFRISMSTSACRESPRKREGKFGYLKTIVRNQKLHIPELGSESGGYLGDRLWPEAIYRRRVENDPDTMKVNVAAVRENGKARIVTSGSFWKEVALQPFSHITINLCKTIDTLSDGLQAGRLGWRFISGVGFTDDDKDGYNFLFRRRPRPYLYTTDWRKATDGPSPEMGRHVTGTLLRKTGLDPETLETILDYWVGPKQLYYAGKHVGEIKRGIPMGDPLTKTNLSLAHPICHRYATLKTHTLAKGKGNGDDVVFALTDPEYVEAFNEAASALGYEYSPLDSCLTRTWGTYCEEYFYLPVSKVNTVKWGSRLRNSLLLPYLDTPKVRVMIATSKDREDFSSDSTGKVTLLGHDEEYIDHRDPSPLKTLYAFASAFQDITLATIDDKKPLFLPRQVNGVGKPPPFWSSTSWMNILERCTPWHRKYYVRVMHEYNEGIGGVSGYRGALKEQNHFSKEMMVELYSIPQDDKVHEFLAVKQSQRDMFPPGVLEKLVATGYLVPESKLAKYYLMQQRLNSLEQDLKQDLFEVIKYVMVPYKDYSPEEEQIVVEKFSSLYRDSPYRLKIDRMEPLYFASSLAHLDGCSPLRVTNSNYSLVEKFRKRIPPSTEYRRKAELLYEWFLGVQFHMRFKPDEKICNPPTDIIEDDPVILLKIQVSSADAIIIVSDDLKLYRLAINKSPGRVIYRMPVIVYLQTRKWLKEDGKLDALIDDESILDSEEMERLVANHLPGEDHIDPDYMYDKLLESFLAEEFKYPGLRTRTLLDSGSIETYENKYNEDDSGALYQTIGIHWTSDISNANLEKKPHHGYFRGIHNRSWNQAQVPRCMGSEDMHRSMKRMCFRSALRKES